jgi:hypothetical protein
MPLPPGFPRREPWRQWHAPFPALGASPDETSGPGRCELGQLFWASQVNPMAAVPPWVSLVVSVRTLYVSW